MMAPSLTNAASDHCRQQGTQKWYDHSLNMNAFRFSKTRLLKTVESVLSKPNKIVVRARK